MTHRTAQAIFEAPIGLGLPGFMTRDVTAEALGTGLDPFLNVSLFSMSQPTFPPHPHAGFSVATYMLPDSEIGFWNHDSRGHTNPIEPGALHWTIAGAGVLHEETVMRSGKQALGFQIWIDHRDDLRELAPDALHLGASQTPLVRGEGFEARVVLGASQGVASPLTPPTRVRLIDVTLQAGAVFTQDLAEGENAFVWVLGGKPSVGDGPTQTAQGGEIIRLTQEGDTLRLTAADDIVRLVIFAGQPMRQQPAMAGPMVASTPAALDTLMAKFRAGGMGRLEPFDQAAIDRAYDEAATR